MLRLELLIHGKKRSLRDSRTHPKDRRTSRTNQATYGKHAESEYQHIKQLRETTRRSASMRTKWRYT